MIELPALTELLRKQPEITSALREVDVLIVQHLFPDTLSLIAALRAENVTVRAVVGIPYSAKDDVVHELENLGIDTLVPDMDKIAEVVLEHVRQSSASGRKSILHEVGGYCASLAADSLELQTGCLGIVEETKQGLWRYSQAGKILLPVVQFADAKLKKCESEFVGRAVARSVDEDLAALGKSLETANVGVIGFGDIGSGVARSFRRRGSHVWCYDKKPIRMMEAAAQGIRCCDPHQLAATCHSIVGATGMGCMEEESLTHLRDGVLLSSASSRDLEFPLDAIRGSSASCAQLTSYVTEYRMKSGKRVRLASDGFPVNFRSFSLPPSFGDLMFCQVLMGFGGILQGTYSLGLHQLRECDQETVANIWWDLYRQRNVGENWEFAV